MTEDLLAKRFQNKLNLLVREPSFWKGIYPDFTISDNPFKPVTPYPVDAALVDAAREQLREEGYFSIEKIIPVSDLEPYLKAIKAVMACGFLPRYALVYDEFYQLLARLEAVLTPILGKGYYLVPDEFEIYHIENNDEKTGTKVHRDSLCPDDCFRSDGLSSIVNVWISLVDVSAHNSCIHVLPANLDPYFQQFGHADEVTNTGASIMQDVRALPVPAGSILGWTPHLLHCGSRSSKRAPHPRLSLAVYFQSADFRPFHKFAMRMDSRLPLAYRLYLIEKVTSDQAASSDEFKEFQSLWYQAQ